MKITEMIVQLHELYIEHGDMEIIHAQRNDLFKNKDIYYMPAQITTSERIEQYLVLG